jgi:hypothetical protein
MKHQMIPLLLISAALSTGCRYGEVLAFGGGGKASLPSSGTDTGSSGSNPDTGPIDTAEPLDGGAPSILIIQTSIEDYPDISWVVELTITYTDPEGDVDGGSVEMFTEIEGQEPMEISIPIDGSQAINDSEDGSVFLAIAVNDGNVSGNIGVVLVDAAGQQSEPYDLSL